MRVPCLSLLIYVYVYVCVYTYGTNCRMIVYIVYIDGASEYFGAFSRNGFSTVGAHKDIFAYIIMHVACVCV